MLREAPADAEVARCPALRLLERDSTVVSRLGFLADA